MKCIRGQIFPKYKRALTDQLQTVTVTLAINGTQSARTAIFSRQPLMRN